MTETTILTTDHRSWVEITLNRPDRLNSFTEEMYEALHAAIDAADADGKRALLLTGAGRGFSAGQDLSRRDPDRLSETPDLSRSLQKHLNPLVLRLRGIAVPVVCAVNGVAAGGGMSLALACDIVLAAHSARFVQSFAKVGLVPDGGSTFMLPRRIGEARAKALAMTAEPISAETAADWGLIWRALPDEDLMREARDLTASLAKGPTVGLAKTKTALQASAHNSLEDQLALEAESQKACGETADYAEGVRAFLERRPPRFTGED